MLDEIFEETKNLRRQTDAISELTLALELHGGVVLAARIQNRNTL